jgi:hypothetical protein
MNWNRLILWSAVFVGLAASGATASAKTLTFGGHTWTVRPDGTGAPRANTWCEDNAFLDSNGYLHLKLTLESNGTWCSAEVYSQDRMGFGTFQWQLNSRVDQLDENVVFGLFQYPTSDVGTDGTNEIDIEFSKWGNVSANALNYTVYPSLAGLSDTTVSYPIALNGNASTHRYIWTSQSVRFQSTHGHYDNNPYPIADWAFSPADSAELIGQAPMPVHMNLWVIAPPSNGQPVEIIITGFQYTPD